MSDTAVCCNCGKTYPKRQMLGFNGRTWLCLECIKGDALDKVMSREVGQPIKDAIRKAGDPA